MQIGRAQCGNPAFLSILKKATCVRKSSRQVKKATEAQVIVCLAGTARQRRGNSLSYFCPFSKTLTVFDSRI